MLIITTPGSCLFGGRTCRSNEICRSAYDI